MDILHATIERLNCLVNSTKLFSKIYGICEVDKAAKDKTVAGINFYTTGGQKEQVTNFDNENGTLFWLRRSNPSMSLIAPSQRTTACEDLFQISFALRGVAVVKKDQLPNDSYTSSDLIAQSITKVLIGNESILKQSMNARRVTITPISYAVDPKEIVKNLNYASVYFDIDVVIQTTKECLPDICAPCDITCPDLPPSKCGGNPITIKYDGVEVTTDVREIDFTGNVEVTLTEEGKILVNVTGGGGSSIGLETNGVVNGDQTKLNLIEGSNVTIVDDGLGGITISSTGDLGVTDVTATLPILSSGGTTPDISISQASGSTDGYLSNDDWNEFNDKFDSPSGLTSQYIRGDGSLATLPTGGGITSINGDTTAAQTLSNGFGGITPNWASGGAGDRQLNIPKASTPGVLDGLIANVDYDKIGIAYSAVFPYSVSTFLCGNGANSIYVDIPNNRMYVASSLGTKVESFDTLTGDLVNVTTAVPSPLLIYRVAANELWVTNGTATTIYRFDLNLVPLSPASFAGGTSTRSLITYSPTRIVGTSTSSGTAIIFVDQSLPTPAIVATITSATLGITNTAWSMVWNQNGSSLHSNLIAVIARNPSSIALVNPATQSVAATAVNPSSLLNSPGDIAYCNLNDCYYITNQTPNKVVVLTPATATTFTVVKSISGILSPFAITCDQVKGLIYVAGGNSSRIFLTIIDITTNRIIRVVEGHRQSITTTLVYNLYLDTVNGFVYLIDVGASGANFSMVTKFKI